jgi:hypothetical protein
MTKCSRDEALEKAQWLKPHKIMLWCSGCTGRLIADRDKTDYPEAVMLETGCPECVGGDFGSSTYYDRKGNEVLYDPIDIGNTEHPLAKGLT